MQVSQKILILSICSIFFAFKGYGQDGVQNPSNYVLGTWVGVVAQDEKDIRSVSWRIHRVDNIKNEIELTEISPFFGSSSRIKPQKTIYKGGSSSTFLTIVMNDIGEAPLDLRFKIYQEDGALRLTNTDEKHSNKGRFIVNFFKLNSDTSTYVPLDGIIEVEVIGSFSAFE